MLNKKDLLIIAQLRENARQTLAKISRKTEVPVSTVYSKIKSYEKGLIKKHTSLVDFQKMGFNIRVKLIVKVKEKEAFQEFVLKNKNLNSVFRIEGGYDFVVDYICRYMSELQDFTRNIEKFGVEKKEMYFVVEDLKRESFLDSLETIYT